MLVCISVSGILFTACSSDIEEGSTTSSQEQKIRENLMEYAEDFDVNFKLNDNISYSKLTEDQVDSLKEMIKVFSSVKGTYKLIRGEKKGVYHAELKNVQTSHPLTRSISYESATSDKEYDSGYNHFYCLYNVYWGLTDTGIITNLSEDGNITWNGASGNSSLYSESRNYGASVLLKGKIIFVAAYGSFTASYYGTISGNKCDVTLS